MKKERDEESAMRSVALQSAQSIFLARQRAERELLEAKEALERKSLQLTQQRELFRITLSSIGDAVITTDLDGKVTFLNPVAESMTGWKMPEAEGLLLERIFRIVNEDTNEPAENPATRTLREGAVVVLANHTTLIARDGTHAAIEDSAAPIRDADGNIIGAVMVFYDVSERRAVERELRQSEARLNQAMEAGQMGVWEWTIATGNVSWSPTLEAIHGLSAGSFGGRFEDFKRDIHPDDLERVVAALTGSLEQRQDYKIRYRIVTPDGSTRRIEARGKLHLDRDGKPERMAGLCVDVTERAKLDEVKSRLAAVVEHSDDAIITKSLDGVITTWNAAANRLFGYTTEEIIGQPISRIIPEDRLGEEKEIIGRLRAGEHVDHYETVRVTKDGRLLNISLTVSPLRDTTGAIIGASKIARDISRQKEIETELRAARDAAESANRTKDEFLATLSHELRTPLTPVLMLAAQMEVSTTLPESVRADFAMIRKNVELEARIIDDLLDLTRITHGKLALRFETVDLHGLLTHALAILRNQSDEKKIEIAINFTAAQHHVSGDAVRLQQVCWNILSNAVKFTPANGRIGIRSWNEDQQLRIAITDTGLGISEEEMPGIFAAFSQGREAAESRFGGLGLGLSISSLLVREHRGRIWAESPGRGQGSTFHLALPLTTPGETSEIASGQAAGSSARSLRILLVENHDDTRRVLGRLISTWGHTVTAVGSVAQARDAVAAHDFDLLISDVGLSDGTGYDVIATLREKSSIPAIAISG
jgi:PAS domain S-box-containing protein